jgi:hypothetical protein
MKISRREFFKKAAVTSGFSFLPSLPFSLAYAQQQLVQNLSQEPHFLLLLRVNGAWDVMSAMDAYNLEEILKEKDIDSNNLLRSAGRMNTSSHESGQLLGSCIMPIKPYMNDISIINGMMMIHNNIIHEVNRSYMSSGSTTSKSAFMPFVIAEKKSAKENKVAYSLERENIESGGFTNLIPAENLSLIKPENIENIFNDLLDSDIDLETLPTQSLQKSLVKEIKSKKQMIISLNEAHQNIAPRFDDQGLMRNTALALSGLASGYIQSAICDIYADVSLDTHNDHDRLHTPNLTECFSRIGNIIKTLKETQYMGLPGSNLKKSLFDLTTVVVMSEFSRTSAPQNGTGTDHNPKNNSCIVFGKNIKGGKIVGKSSIFGSNSIGQDSTLLHANLYDYNLDRALSKSEFVKFLKSSNTKISACNPSGCLDYIYPETIWRTILKAFGLSEVAQIKKGPILKGLISG